jgi:two-component system cell cycle sensor histidine kinase/response regulator CckA
MSICRISWAPTSWRRIKARNRDISVIVITGDANLDSALAALRCGAYDYLRKPFEFEEFLKTVENALNQKALKQEKDKINHKLYRSEERYRYLVQNSPDIIYTLDADGNFTFLSEALEHLLGFTVDELIGKHYTTIVCEEDRDKAQWFFDERRSRDRAASGIELRLKAGGDGQQNDSARRYLTVELKSMGIYEASTNDGERRHVGTHGVIRDISERHRLHAQLQNAERMESLGTLAGGIAHDFNNLLMGIQGRSSLIAMDLEDTHPVLEHLHAIDNYILSATHLTKQLLGLARGGKYEVKPTDINELILKSANMFGRTKKEITIETRFHDANIVVDADRRQIEQVLLNLYVNAWQAMPEGGTCAWRPNPSSWEEGLQALSGGIRTLCPCVGHGYRYRHGPEDAPTHLRSIFYDKRKKPRDGIGFGIGLWHHQKPCGYHSCEQQTWLWYDI